MMLVDGAALRAVSMRLPNAECTCQALAVPMLTKILHSGKRVEMARRPPNPLDHALCINECLRVVKVPYCILRGVSALLKEYV